MAARHVRVTVPASTANLGSGFDALGLALGLHDVVEVRSTGRGLVIRATGEGADSVPTDESHPVVSALRATGDRLGVPFEGLELNCHNMIPHARGLGSSAAAVVAGVAAGYALAGRDLDDEAQREEALQIAAGFEGHADNAAASLRGGLAVAWQEDGRYRSVRLSPHPGLRVFALVPADRSATRTTRGLLPDRVPHADAAFAAGRAALAVHALTTAPEYLLPATDDRLHQGYREPAWPATVRLVGALRAAGVAAAVSGAGPTVLALGIGDALPDGIDRTGFSLLPLDVDTQGVRVEQLD